MKRILYRKDILQRAYNECLTEMFAKAQPSADFNALMEGVKNGTIIDNDANPIYKRYYLSEEEFRYILKKYKDLYNIKCEWKNHIGLLEGYFTGNGKKDVWLPDKYDSNGNRIRSAHRGIEKVPHISDSIYNILKEKISNTTDAEELSKEITGKVMTYINDCREFYTLDLEEYGFETSVALGCSPTSNKEDVIKYWKEQGIDVNIVDRNPNLLWDMDYYGDDFEKVMKDVYGEDWKKITWDEYYDR